MHFGHDHLFRHTFSQPEHAASLLRSILPAPLARGIDWSTLRRLPGSTVDEALRACHTDLTFAAEVDGAAVLLYLLLEHESTADRFTAYQLLRYVVRTWDAFRAEQPAATALPPIVPIVVHHGPRAFRAPRSVHDLVDLDGVPPALRPYLSPLQPTLHFLLDDLAVRSSHAHAAREVTPPVRLTLLLLQFVRAANAADPAEFVQRWQDLWQALWQHPRGKFTLLALLSYLAWQLQAPPDRLAIAAAMIHEDARTMGKTIAEQLIEQGMQRGEEIGRREGARRARIELLTRLLQRRFGALPAPEQDRIATAEPAALERWAEQLLDAPTLDAALR